MSIPEIERSILLNNENLLNHRELVNEEINKFQDAFERNNRFKEFECFLRKDHKIYEAIDTPILNILQSNMVQSITQKINDTTERLKRLSKPLLDKSVLDSMNLSNDITSTEIFKLVKQEIKKAKEKSAKIIETE